MEHRSWEGGGEGRGKGGGGRGGKRRVMKKGEERETLLRERVTLLRDGNKDLTVVHSLAGPTRGKPWQHALLTRREEGRGGSGD